MKVKTAIVLPYFGNGGAENMVSRLVSNLDMNKVEAEVICIYGKPQNNSLEKAVIDNGVTIKYVNKGLGFSTGAIIAIWKELNRFKPNIVHTHLGAGAYCGLWVAFHKVRMLHTVHNMPAFEFQKPKRIVLHFLYKIGKAVPVAISKEIQCMVKQEYKLKEDPELIYNPVEIKKYSEKEKHRYPKFHSDFIFITVGRLSQQKNQKLLIDAFADMLLKTKADSKLWILGEGPLRAELECYISEKGLNDKISLVGQTEHVEDYLSEADAFVLSSNYEGLPLSILEAMSAGLPIIATDVGGVKDIVTDNGILVNPQSREELCDALCDIIEKNSLREKMSENSLRNVDPFDSAEIANQYTGLYYKYS